MKRLMGLFICGVLFLSQVPTHGKEQAGWITYALAEGHQNWPPNIKKKIVDSMDKAVKIYNTYGNFRKAIVVDYKPSVPTANANYNGKLNFGQSIGERTALHEISHTLGVGTTGKWKQFVKEGVWLGERGQALVRIFDGKEAVLQADEKHFWPYGLNYSREGESQKLYKRHVQMVMVLCQDMDLPTVRTSRSPVRLK